MKMSSMMDYGKTAMDNNERIIKTDEGKKFCTFVRDGDDITLISNQGTLPMSSLISQAYDPHSPYSRTGRRGR